jgi:hypothetical protein
VTQPALYSLSKLGTLAHFNTPTIANGKVFVGANLSLQVLGLLGNLQATSGNNQTVPSLTTAPLPLQVTAKDAYTGALIAGATVTFKDGGKGGVFSPNGGIVSTNASGHASVSYTVPKLAGIYTITATYPASTTAKFTVTVVGGTATHIAVISGNKQTGTLQTAFPLPLVVQLDDASNNGVPGGTITFPAPSASGSFSPASVVTDARGRAQTFYTSGTKSGSLAIAITSGALHQGMSEIVQPGPATSLIIISGNSQKAAASTTLPVKLTAKVVDQFGNGIPGVSVNFNAAGLGVFATSPAITDAQGRAMVAYTLPPTPQVVHVTASLAGVNPVTFTETAQ